METIQLCYDDLCQARIISREEHLLLAKVAEEAERYEGISPELSNTLQCAMYYFESNRKF